MDKEMLKELLYIRSIISNDLGEIAQGVGQIIEFAILDEEDKNKARNLVHTIQGMEETIHETLLSAPSLDPEFKEALKNY